MRFRKLFAFFVVPLAVKFWTYIEPVNCALWDDRHEVLEWTVGASVHMVLFVGPLLVIVGWLHTSP